MEGIFCMNNKVFSQQKRSFSLSRPGMGNHHNASNAGNRSLSNGSIESQGPEGKVRGNAIQISERYLVRAKELINQDSTLAERFFQQAEHFMRIHNSVSAMQKRRSSESKTPAREEQPQTNLGQKDPLENKEQEKDNKNSQDLGIVSVRPSNPSSKASKGGGEVRKKNNRSKAVKNVSAQQDTESYPATYSLDKGGSGQEPEDDLFI
jgi:hypothetical protein